MTLHTPVVTPIKPSEVIEFKKNSIPLQVITVVNDLIKHKWNGNKANIKQKDIIVAVCSALGCTENHVYNKHMLDFEDLFREQGWNVRYNKPGYNEDYDAYFTFTIPK